MGYSIEEIYRQFGQYDKIVTVSFLDNSPSYEEYNDSVTGSFYYSLQERRVLEEQIDKTNDSLGFVKFKEILNNVDDVKKENLMSVGINCEDIAEIFYLIQINQENKFQSKKTRKLPNPNIIEYDIDDDFDYDSMLLNLNERKIADGYKLTPEETAEHRGTLLNRYNKSIESINQEPEDLKILIKKYFLKCRLKHKQAEEKEITELKELESRELEHKILILQDEIKKSSIGKGKERIEKIKPQIEQITPFFIEFSEKRLTHGKSPIWLNYERFLHIFLRHVDETNLGGNFEDKTKFQYLIDDIFRLIEIVLDSIEDDIQKHFIERPDTNFKRHGEMAIYYNGDYYVVDINPDGLLMTFYKRE